MEKGKRPFRSLETLKNLVWVITDLRFGYIKSLMFVDNQSLLASLSTNPNTIKEFT